MTNILVIIPARGGSKGIPRKNLRILNNKPLIYYAIQNALSSTHNPDVYVTSESVEILSIASKVGAKTYLRPQHLSDDKTTLDPVIYDAWKSIEKLEEKQYDVIVTCQATSPLLKTKSLDDAINTMNVRKDIDSILSGIPKLGLSWIKDNGNFVPNYQARVNRQQLEPVYYETGSFFLTRPKFITENNRLGNNIYIQEISEEEGIDIDDFQDWNLCEYFLQRKKIVIATSGYSKIGMGHIYRMLLVSDQILNHDIHFIVDNKSEVGHQKINETHYKVSIQVKDDIIEDILALAPDVVISDHLDTDADYIKRLNEKGILTINFEDRGPGSKEAAVLINALYKKDSDAPNRYFGPDFFCARSEFLLSDQKKVQPDVKNVLITYGGTDPNNLTLKVLDAIYDYCTNHGIQMNIITGPGYQKIDTLTKFVNATYIQNVPNISDYMLDADIVFTSAGRTAYELAILGTPSIVLAQNERELCHPFASEDNGFHNHGLGVAISKQDILENFTKLCDNYNLREEMSEKMKRNDLKSGIFRVINIIQSAIKKNESK